MTAQGWAALVSIITPLTGAVGYLIKRVIDMQTKAVIELLELARNTNDTVNHGRMERLEEGVALNAGQMVALTQKVDKLHEDFQIITTLWEQIVQKGGKRAYDL